MNKSVSVNFILTVIVLIIILFISVYQNSIENNNDLHSNFIHNDKIQFDIIEITNLGQTADGISAAKYYLPTIIGFSFLSILLITLFA
jgi:hypothetical protein